MFQPGHSLPWYAAWEADPRHESILLPVLGLNSPANRLALLPSSADDVLISQALLGKRGGGGGGGKPGTPPNNRGRIPPRQDGDRIYKFNNPNKSTFPGVSRRVPKGFRNKIGYRTYVQFMVDHGRDLKPVRGQYVPLSHHSPDCPWHAEATAGGTFSFPPRTQPMHAARRALIAAIQVIKERNQNITDLSQRDWVSIVTFDTLSGGGPVIEQVLTGDYDSAMLACTQLQAVGDKRATTATEAGLITAKEHVRPSDQGGQGRMAANKVVVLLTDGLPNLYVSDPSDIDDFMADNPSDDYYQTGEYWFDAPLMQTASMQMQKWSVFPVGIGLGCDYGFMDRMARLGGTDNEDGESPRGSGNPAEYEQRLAEIFEKIITNPQIRLVQ